MCGLTFLFDDSLDEACLRQRTEAALSRLRHRGPDGQGLFTEAHWGIGHRRLAIIDLAGSPQPMADPARRFFLAYNGEIYNYPELRRGLVAHWDFRTEGDTEVLLAGLAVHGTRFLDGVQGMFAFVLWDRAEQRALLGRDRLGKKPLFYQQTGRSLACASELAGLACLAPAGWNEDLDSTADFLRYGYTLPGTTFYREVREVLPGHVLEWTPDTAPRQRPYWSLALGGFRGSRGEAGERLRELLVDAVRKRLVADVEVGAFLSGGVDSSLIVGILRDELGVRPKTFTIGFSERSFDERRHARTLAARFDTEHHEEECSGWDRELLERLVMEHVGQPFMDSSLLPTALVARLTARHVKVALSGDGGDELFSGYQRYQARLLLRWYGALPQPVRRGVAAALAALPEPAAHHSASLLKKAFLFQDIVARQESERPYVAPVLFAADPFRRLVPDLVHRGHPPPALPSARTPDDVQEMMAADALVYLPQDILTKVDRATMAYSLEARAPFLDHRLVELAFSLPRPWHRRGLRGKRLLTEVFADLLPAAIRSRRKQGFAVPVHPWFRGSLGDELERELGQRQAGPLDNAAALGYLAAHRRGLRDHGYRLWLIYIYLIWRRRCVWLR